MDAVGYFLNQLFGYFAEYAFYLANSHPVLEGLMFTMIHASQAIWDFGELHGALPWR